ncbi:putative aldehyde reductase putativeoxidoreductase [Leptomonas pyrrhocoris]|uniref:Putative aldehyde reductase putativeoxidoreductase n=1 Tax=Leptomonas pyrrhocoris TaxID=157538 RepID=A0A0N0DX88_LEPPY|nr:putative aldehyde reductase putativeoxidoreductase [Leptomonas pyrrhocoris]XP_015661144.1 putative aldehyde reductase putativeoxidoreductase [Leptomonas pyrrhocoris]XP_015661145.1 putative aldehyde reductase putativeoxidoreductase [Leptomonas pyrrhocoris]XP_015661146.1 putative aldehyde reductase putativeoxidoreductase [Leptomonas pyrrhocoris]KPA82704.1 putative aldehyde reductase putativeoxidoreductase [Leptomonas pyrrhocoris]KPA82705.1 putative aldehyde reductase putativeoxidoreductase [L|eukprot:XP_015661143.1 putative aldehyde reductase putativeoxidoreductase [Leptomonas pyrrhocoris]
MSHHVTVPRRELGKSGLFVSQIGLGCMGMSFGIGSPEARDDKRSIEVIREAFRLGINFFDTAQVYGPHKNEELLGEAISTLPRDQLVIATKCGIYTRDGKSVADSRPEILRDAIEGSLKRLRTSYVDLYYIHRIDPTIPIEDVARTMLQFKKEGKIRHWGVSEASVATVRRAHAVFPLTAVQSEYSLMFREPEKELIPTLRELGIGFVPFSPLGRGFLTATINADTKFDAGDIRANLPRFSKDNVAKNLALVSLVKEMAERKGATPSQIALAWVTSQAPFIAPIPGTTKLERLKENIGSVAVHFTPDELADFTKNFDALSVEGDRYPAALEAMVDRSR